MLIVIELKLSNSNNSNLLSPSSDGKEFAMEEVSSFFALIDLAFAIKFRYLIEVDVKEFLDIIMV